MFCSDGITDLRLILHQHLVASRVGLNLSRCTQAWEPGPRERAESAFAEMWLHTPQPASRRMQHHMLLLLDCCFITWTTEQPSVLKLFYVLPRTHSTHNKSAQEEGWGKENCISWLHSPLEDTIVRQPYITKLLFLTINLLINLTPLRLCGHAQSFSGGLQDGICKLRFPHTELWISGSKILFDLHRLWRFSHCTDPVLCHHDFGSLNNSYPKAM